MCTLISLRGNLRGNKLFHNFNTEFTQYSKQPMDLCIKQQLITLTVFTAILLFLQYSTNLNQLGYLSCNFNSVYQTMCTLIGKGTRGAGGVLVEASFMNDITYSMAERKTDYRNCTRTRILLSVKYALQREILQNAINNSDLIISFAAYSLLSKFGT